MSDIKQLLKEAKGELANEEYEDAIALSLQVLELDPENYFANVFLGKAYSCESLLKDLGKAARCYIAAALSQPQVMLAWKGLFMLLGSHGQQILPAEIEYKELFQVCNVYMSALQAQELPQVDLINYLKELKSQHKTESAFLEPFYEVFSPGNEEFESLGKHLTTPTESLSGLMRIVKRRETAKISEIVSHNRMKLSSNDPNYQSKINALAWEIYEKSKLDDYFNRLVNVTDDDKERASLENEWLEYRIKVLKATPAEDKPRFFETVKTMVEDMVLVDHDSLVAWKSYFDWQDYESLDDMDPKVVLRFFSKYPNEPLAIILYAWINSRFSTYNVAELEKEMEKENGTAAPETQTNDNDNGNDDEDDDEAAEVTSLMEADEEMSGALKEEDILSSIIENIDKIKNSTTAYRILSHYYMLNREYSASLPYIKAGITLISYYLRDLGAYLKHSKHELTIDIATCYTYIDAPKNHKAALSLFDKILSEDPNNIRSMIGKSIISIEKENWEEAYNLLTDVISRTPSNLEVQSQLAWCMGNLSDFDESIERFTTVVNKIEGADLRTMDFKAENLWREAKIYIMKYESEDNESNIQLVQTAFKLLIQIAKYCSDTFAKSYSLLGDIYVKYFKDPSRAFKCYYKAFELDSSDISSAHYITEVYCDSADWNAASQITGRLIKDECAVNELRKTSWPYRVMGISFIEKQMEAESIEYFQAAIRISPSDVESWVGLGQAYLGCGRVEASIKVFEKVLTLDENHMFAQYFYAKALSEIGEFEQAIPIMKSICLEQPGEETVIMLLAELLVKYAYDLYNEGFLIKSSATTIDAISAIKTAVCALGCSTQNAWIILSTAIYLFSLVESQIDELPLENLLEIFQTVELRNTNTIDALDGVTLDSLLAEDNQDNISIALKFLILSAKYAVSTSSFDILTSTVKSACWHNIGTTELSAFVTLNDTKYRDAAIDAFKKAIECQSNNIETWIGLGMATMDINYRVSQHCFIKAVALSPKDINIWFNLAILGLKNNDVLFATEIITKTQSLEPQSSSPWLGLALIKETEGVTKEGHELFAHSFVLSRGRSKISQLLFSKSVLEMRIGHNEDERDIDALEEFTAMIFGLEQYFKKNPNNPYAIQCALIALERLHNFSKAKTLCQRLMDILEKNFEVSQDETELFHFAVIKSQLARIQLGLGEYDSAIENASLSDGILADYQGGDVQNSKSFPALLSNHVCLGLANFFQGDFDTTLTHFQELLELSKESRCLVALLSKVLYDVGSEEAKSIASQELMEYTSAHRFDLVTTLLISAMTLLENQEKDILTALQHLLNLPLFDLINDKHGDIPYIVKEFISKINGSKEQTRVKPGVDFYSQRSAFFFPQRNESWSSISKTIQQRVASEGQNKITAEQLSDLYRVNGNLRNIQRSIYFSPWNKQAVASIKGCF